MNESSLRIGFIFLWVRITGSSITYRKQESLRFVTVTNPSVMDSDYKNGQNFSGDIFNPPVADKIKQEMIK